MMKNLFSYFLRLPVFMIGVIVLSLWIKEFYPFSHFPMYSTFGSRSHYVYLANSKGQPIPTRRYFDYSVPKLKKMFLTRLRTIKSSATAEVSEGSMRRQAAIELLEYLLARTDKAQIQDLEALQLYYVDLELVDKTIHRSPTYLAEVKLR